MGRGFRRSGARFRCRLDPDEAFVVRRLARELQTLLDGAAEPPRRSAGEPPAAGPVAGEPPAAEQAAADNGAVDELRRMVGLPEDPPDRPTDPVLVRLFPDAYTDRDAATEFRRFTQYELASGKRDRLGLLCDTISERGGDVVLDAAAAEAWLAALNDLRLAVGTRVGMTEDTDLQARLAADPSTQAMLGIYDFLTYLQGTLVEALAGW